MSVGVVLLVVFDARFGGGPRRDTERDKGGRSDQDEGRHAPISLHLLARMCERYCERGPMCSEAMAVYDELAEEGGAHD
jgi:hypothetical protein